METIQNEIAKNGGIYPHNKGAISLAEIARRSQIHPVTFHKPRYVELHAEVEAWLETLKQGATVGRLRVRKELAKRIHEWKELYEDLLETHHLTETDLVYAQAQVEEVVRENEQLQERLSDQANSNILSIRPTKRS